MGLGDTLCPSDTPFLLVYCCEAYNDLIPFSVWYQGYPKEAWEQLSIGFPKLTSKLTNEREQGTSSNKTGFCFPFLSVLSWWRSLWTEQLEGGGGKATVRSSKCLFSWCQRNGHFFFLPPKTTAAHCSDRGSPEVFRWRLNQTLTQRGSCSAS